MNVLKNSLRTLVALITVVVCLSGIQGFAEKSAADIAAIGKAVARGDAKAQYNLGVRYANGEGVPKDDAEAVKWYRKTAEQGDATAQYAQYSLGVCYANGTGVPQDLVNSYKWILIANASGHEGAKIAKKSFKEFLKRKQIAEAQKLGREWKPKEQ